MGRIYVDLIELGRDDIPQECHITKSRFFFSFFISYFYLLSLISPGSHIALQLPRRLYQNRTWNQRRPEKKNILMYPWSDLEGNVAVHPLKRAIREKSSGSGSSEKVRGKAPRKGSDKKWLRRKLML